MALRDAAAVDLTIRVGRMDDLPEVYQIVREAYSPYVSRIGSEPASMTTDFSPAVERGELFVAESGGTLLAVMLLRLHSATLEVSSVAVRRGQQRRGIGAGLLAFAEERARIQKVRQLSLYTNAALDELVEYYCRCGFVVRERRMEHGFDRVFMTKDVVSSANPPRG